MIKKIKNKYQILHDSGPRKGKSITATKRPVSHKRLLQLVEAIESRKNGFFDGLFDNVDNRWKQLKNICAPKEDKDAEMYIVDDKSEGKIENVIEGIRQKNPKGWNVDHYIKMAQKLENESANEIELIKQYEKLLQAEILLEIASHVSYYKDIKDIKVKISDIQKDDTEKFIERVGGLMDSGIIRYKEEIHHKRHDKEVALRQGGMEEEQKNIFSKYFPEKEEQEKKKSQVKSEFAGMSKTTMTSQFDKYNKIVEMKDQLENDNSVISEMIEKIKSPAKKKRLIKEKNNNLKKIIMLNAKIKKIQKNAEKAKTISQEKELELF